MAHIDNPADQALDVADLCSEELVHKYARGQKEHGGNFFEKPTIHNIREEVLDLIAYTHVALLHKQELVALLTEIMEDACAKRPVELKLVKAVTMANNL